MNYDHQKQKNPPALNSNDEILRRVVANAIHDLALISDETAAAKPHKDKWSIKEILGHLIDSSINNTRRFVMAPRLEDMIFEGYDQAYWVELNAYQNREWTDIIDTWARFNHNMSLLIKNLPVEALQKQFANHNLDMVAFRKMERTSSVTLDGFIKDYIGHIEHHLLQIDELIKLSEDNNTL